MACIEFQQSGVDVSWKSKSEFIELLTTKIGVVESPLQTEYQNVIILRNKILVSIHYIETCRLTYHKSLETVQAVILNLHAFLATTS